MGGEGVCFGVVLACYPHHVSDHWLMMGVGGAGGAPSGLVREGGKGGSGGFGGSSVPKWTRLGWRGEWEKFGTG